MKPNCECCNKDLPVDSAEAMICTFECAFCRGCVEAKLNFVCPNCGGNLVPRPVRPTGHLIKYPPSAEHIYKPEGCSATVKVV